MRKLLPIFLCVTALGMSASLTPPLPEVPSAAGIEDEEDEKPKLPLLPEVEADDERTQLPMIPEIEEDEYPAVDPEIWVDTALLHQPLPLPEGLYTDLTEEDYLEVAEELGLEPAVIKAVVDIEAGKKHEGFWKPGKPLINFDLSMYRKFAPRHGVSLTKAKKKCPEIFARPNVRKYGSYQAGQYARLEAAYGIDEASAMESTFWGMFQIGGFNWRKCGTDSVQQFVKMMSRSERDQLELFARFITNSGMLDDLRAKRWLAFALKYNGPKARKRGYHTRLAAAYRKYSK